MSIKITDLLKSTHEYMNIKEEACRVIHIKFKRLWLYPHYCWIDMLDTKTERLEGLQTTEMKFFQMVQVVKTCNDTTTKNC